MKEFVEKLIKKLYENVKSNSCPSESCWEHSNKDCDKCDFKKIMIRDVIETVNQLAEEYNNGWIDCEKELPKESKLYEVTIEKTVCSKKQYITDYRLFGTENEWISADKVIAWREKAEPYQKGE